MSGIARIREGTRAEVRAHENAVPVLPGNVALGFGEEEPVLNERFRLGVKLPRHRGIRSAPRQGDEAAIIARFQPRCPVPDPALLFRFAECVEIENDLPLWVGLAIFFERGPTPEAPLVLLVAPEVVKKIAGLAHLRDAFFGVENPQQPLVEFLELCRFGEFVGAGFVLLLDPRERLFARDLFQPEVGIFLLSERVRNSNSDGSQRHKPKVRHKWFLSDGGGVRPMVGASASPFTRAPRQYTRRRKTWVHRFTGIVSLTTVAKHLLVQPKPANAVDVGGSPGGCALHTSETPRSVLE